MYIYEQDKIDYIKDHYKDKTFEVIKAKANPTSVNAYITSSKMIQDLVTMFSEFNKVPKLNILFHDLEFDMAVINFKQIIDKFFARFTSTIVSLDFTN